MGCYTLEGTAEHPTLGAEWNTATHPADAASLPPKGVNPLSEPAIVLALVVWRRQAMVAWAAESVRTLWRTARGAPGCSPRSSTTRAS